MVEKVGARHSMVPLARSWPEIFGGKSRSNLWFESPAFKGNCSRPVLISDS